MKLNPLLYVPALFISAPALANAATLVVANQDYNLRTFFITNGANQDFTFDGGGGNTITLKVIGVNAAGEPFSDLDRTDPQTGGHIGVGSAGGDLPHFDSSEDVTFTVSYVSHTGAVDASSLAFRFDKIGFRALGASGNVAWTVNNGTPITVAVVNNTDVYRSLDTTFTTIGTSGTYSGVFENQLSSQQGQLSALPTSVLAGDGTRGLQFSVQFNTIPEPSVALLGGFGALALLRRRRS